MNLGHHVIFQRRVRSNDQVIWIQRAGEQPICGHEKRLYSTSLPTFRISDSWVDVLNFGVAELLSFCAVWDSEWCRVTSFFAGSLSECLGAVLSIRWEVDSWMQMCMVAINYWWHWTLKKETLSLGPQRSKRLVVLLKSTVQLRHILVLSA